ncbi:alpha/beta hydrolase [Oricola sp.]|uniref:alpha/beta fold hydrolase n=1 Tax=Oricola sp. TaxID=1979950 RepID=UPI0025F0EA1A|nr:alpha/beta hydrolase [Oricola sp.]MCI5076171.1 alpha/beta hydrolase [Oricola sp.]
MVERRSVYVSCGEHELHVSTWGDEGKPALIMWHGLARTGRDFDEAAIALSDDYFVICPDTLGRGLSSWAKDAATGYTFATYGAHAEAILDHFGVTTLRWIGTSMGGLIGVTLAAGALKGRITHLVVNDIGPWIPEEAAGRIRDYVGSPPSFDTIGEMEHWLRTSYAPFGQNSDVFWRRMADTSSRRKDDGRVTVHYDPQIVSQFTLHKSDLDCWPAWDAIGAKTLLLRGAQSDVLPKAVASEMCERGPKPELVEFAGVGHAPTLATNDESRLLRAFLA